LVTALVKLRLTTSFPLPPDGVETLSLTTSPPAGIVTVTAPPNFSATGAPVIAASVPACAPMLAAPTVIVSDEFGFASRFARTRP
jgi:hypothetical protein